MVLLLVAVLEVEDLILRGASCCQFLDLIAHFEDCLSGLLIKLDSTACSDLNKFADHAAVMGAELLINTCRMSYY